MNKKVLSLTAICLVMGLAGTSWVSAETFVIPHFVDGLFDARGLVERRFVVNLLVFNPSDQELPVTLEAFDDQGAALDFSFDGPGSIQPSGLARYRFSFLQLVSGWFRITTAGPALLRSSIQLLEIDNFDPPPATGFPTRVQTEADADPAPATRHGVVPVFLDPLGRTGVALVFPSSSSENAIATLTLRGTAGQSLGSAEISLPSNGRSVFVVEDMFPASGQGEEAGTLEFSCDEPLVGTTIRFLANPVFLHTVSFGSLPGN